MMRSLGADSPPKGTNSNQRPSAWAQRRSRLKEPLAREAARQSFLRVKAAGIRVVGGALLLVIFQNPVVWVLVFLIVPKEVDAIQFDPRINERLLTLEPDTFNASLGFADIAKE